VAEPLYSQMWFGKRLPPAQLREDHLFGEIIKFIAQISV
jgi:hypothetical protein